MREQQPEIKYLTSNELNRLFKAIKNDKSKYTVRNYAMFRIAYYCALRASEVGLIEPEFFNLNSKEIYCKRLKGSLNNTLKILDSETLRALKKYIREYNPKGRLFLSQKGNPISRKTLDAIMKKYCKDANIEDKSKHHFHVLKHTRAVFLADAGLDIREIQYWLGHKQICNTQIYLQFTSKQHENLYRKLYKVEEYDYE